MSKHTELHLCQPIGSGYCASIFRDPDGHGWMVAQVANGVDNERLAEMFVAAPEMLDALKHCEQVLNDYEINRVDGEEIADKALALIRAAIKKAEGQA